MNTPTPTSTPDSPLANRVALVTGAARRVGRAIALRLAQQGMHVAFTYHTSTDDAQRTAQQIEQLGRRAMPIRIDLSDPYAADRVHDAFTSQFNSLHALVNNAAVYAPTPLNRVTPSDFHHHMAVNALAPLMLIHKFAALLGAGHRFDDPATVGRVVNLLDAHTLGQPQKKYINYSASKAALLDITKTCALELAPKVTINGVAPGVVAWNEAATPKQRDQYLSRVPLARHGTPEDAAAAVLFLIRDAHYTTGHVVHLDGGRLLT